MSRPSRKNAYNTYLNSATWKRLRKQALERDGGRCRGCGGRALHVHHARYPHKLGTEKPEWLYSLCISCHEAIHALVNQGETLGNATLSVVSDRNRAAPKKGRRKKKQVTREDLVRLKNHLSNPRPKVSQNKRRTLGIQEENDLLHKLAVKRRAREAAKKGQ